MTYDTLLLGFVGLLMGSLLVYELVLVERKRGEEYRKRVANINDPEWWALEVEKRRALKAVQDSYEEKQRQRELDRV